MNNHLTRRSNLIRRPSKESILGRVIKLKSGILKKEEITKGQIEKWSP